MPNSKAAEDAPDTVVNPTEKAAPVERSDGQGSGTGTASAAVPPDPPVVDSAKGPTKEIAPEAALGDEGEAGFALSWGFSWVALLDPDVGAQLRFRAAAGDLAGVEECLESGAFVDAPGAFILDRDLIDGGGGGGEIKEEEAGATALMLAARGGFADVCAALLKAGADPSLRQQQQGDAPLHCAARQGHLEVGSFATLSVLFRQHKQSQNLRKIRVFSDGFTSAEARGGPSRAGARRGASSRGGRRGRALGCGDPLGP